MKPSQKNQNNIYQMELEDNLDIFTNVNIPYYAESMNQIKKNIDIQEIKDKLDQDEMNIKNKKEMNLVRTKQIVKRVYSITVLRNKKNPQKILYKLDRVGQTRDKYDFQDYKDIFFEQPISTKQLIDSFKEEVVESIQCNYQPPKRNTTIKKKQPNENEQQNIQIKIEQKDDSNIQSQKQSRFQSEDNINVGDNQANNQENEGEGLKRVEVLNEIKKAEKKTPFLKDEVNPRLYHYCIQPQIFMKNYKLNKLEFFRENLNQVQRQQKSKNIFQSLQVSYNNAQIPKQANYGHDLFQEDDLYKIMKKLFEDRPIWIRNSLVVYLNKHNIKYTLFNFRKTNCSAINSKQQYTITQNKKRALAMLSYNFKDGPWKHAYVRFGYNPKENKEAVNYQIIDIVVQDREDYEQAKEYNPIQQQQYTKFKEIKLIKNIQIRNTYDPTYIEKPQHYRHMYMLCEIKDDHVKKFFEKALQKDEFKNKETPCKKSGWLQSIDIKRIQKVMKDKFKFN